jgi:hypothetical protein
MSLSVLETIFEFKHSSLSVWSSFHQRRKRNRNNVKHIHTPSKSIVHILNVEFVDSQVQRNLTPSQRIALGLCCSVEETK